LRRTPSVYRFEEHSAHWSMGVEFFWQACSVTWPNDSEWVVNRLYSRGDRVPPNPLTPHTLVVAIIRRLGLGESFHPGDISFVASCRSRSSSQGTSLPYPHFGQQIYMGIDLAKMDPVLQYPSITRLTARSGAGRATQAPWRLRAGRDGGARLTARRGWWVAAQIFAVWC